MPNRLDGKVAVITGGASGLGEASARLFASEGARVLIADRDASRGPQVAAEIGDAARFVETDVRSGEDVQGMFAVADEAWGRVDVIYNNAGVGGPEGRVTECSEERYDLISDVNIRGVWLGMKYGIPHLERAGGGSIIVTASIAAITGVAGVSAYCASKGAVVAMVQAAAGEWASKNIRINCILPGNIATGQGSRSEEQIEQSREFMASYNPVRRSGEAIDIANAALFLASDASSLITGQKLVVDGGWTSLDDRYVQVMGPQYSQG